MYKVRVPQTSANLGSGFDTLGIALSVYNYFSVEDIESGLGFEGCKKEFSNEDNLLYASMMYVFKLYNYEHKYGFKFTFQSNIKDCSGLGSSATCIVAGVMIGASILEESKIYLTKDDIIKIAIDIEGHGDNVVPAILGSLTVVMRDDEEYIYRKINVSNKFKFATLTSDLEKKSTKHLRSVLSNEVSLNDAIFNISHAIMTTYAIENGDVELLKRSIKDKLHEDYRKVFIEDFDLIKQKALEFGAISLNISGSGPSLILIYDQDFKVNEFKSFIERQNNNWVFTNCEIDFGGAKIEEA